MGLQPYPLKGKKMLQNIIHKVYDCKNMVHVLLLSAYLLFCNLVFVHELLADDILTNAGGRHQVVELVEELHTALMVVRCSFTQLVPQNQGYTLGTCLRVI